MNALSQQKREEILILARLGYSFREIAYKLGVNRGTVSCAQMPMGSVL